MAHAHRTPTTLTLTPSAHAADRAALRLAALTHGWDVCVQPFDDGSTPAVASLKETCWLQAEDPWPVPFDALLKRPHGLYQPGGEEPPMGAWCKPTVPKAHATWRRQEGQEPEGWRDTAWYWSEHVPDVLGEVRFYVANGVIVHAAQYDDLDGEDVEITQEIRDEVLNVDPGDWVGTVDVAVTPHGLRLLECHAPYGCGLYESWRLEVASKLLIWVQAGWQWLCENRGLTP